MSSSSSSQSVPFIPPLYLSSHELSRMVTHPEFVFPLARMFTNDPLPSAVLRYYGFISQTIDNLEREEERCRQEQETVFEALISNSNFRTRIQPIIRRFREHHVPHRFHPYGRTPSPPRTSSSPNSVSPPSEASSIQILPEEALAQIPTPGNNSPVSSYCTAIDELPGTKWNPIMVVDDEEHGTKQNPIVISDGDDDLNCDGCGGEHQFQDCTREYLFNREKEEFVLIPEGESPFGQIGRASCRERVW